MADYSDLSSSEDLAVLNQFATLVASQMLRIYAWDMC